VVKEHWQPGNTLLLTARYLELNTMLPHLADLESSIETKIQTQEQQQQEQEQERQQGAEYQLSHLLAPSLANMLPAVTAAALKATSALLQDLADYLPPQTGLLGMNRQRSSPGAGTKRVQPLAVQALLSKSEALLTVSSRLQRVCACNLLQHLSHHLQQQIQASHSTCSSTSSKTTSSTPWSLQAGRHSVDCVHSDVTSAGIGASSDTLSSSTGGHRGSGSSSGGTGPAQRASSVLLLHADWLESQRLEQVPGDPAVVQALLLKHEQLSHCWLSLGSAAVEQQPWHESGQSSHGQPEMQGSSSNSSSSNNSSSSSSNNSSRALLSANLGYQPSRTGSATLSVIACLRGAAAAADAIEYSMAHMAQSTAGRPMASRPADLATSAWWRGTRMLDSLVLVSAAVAAVRLCGGEALNFVAAGLSASTRLLDAAPATPEGFWAKLPGSMSDRLISNTWHTIAMFTQLAQQLICLLDQKGAQAAAANDKPYAPSADAEAPHKASSTKPSPAAAGTAAAGALTAWQLKLGRVALLQTVLLLAQLLREVSVALCPGHGRGASPQELQYAAFALQVIEAAVRWNERHVALRNNRAQSIKALETALGEPVAQNSGLMSTQFSGALRALHAVMKHILMPDQQPAPHVSSSEGQQLVQACLSLMLTGTSLLQQISHSPTLFEVDLCVKLLQLSMAAESANDKQPMTAAAAAGTLPGTDAAATNSSGADQGQSSAQDLHS